VTKNVLPIPDLKTSAFNTETKLAPLYTAKQRGSYLHTAEPFSRGQQLCNFSRTSQYIMESEGWFCVHKSPSLVIILSQINPDHTTPSYLSKICNIHQPNLPNLLFPSGFPTYNLYAVPSFVLHAIVILLDFITLILKLVVCILLRVLGQVQGFRLTQHWFQYFYLVTATCFGLMTIFRRKIRVMKLSPKGEGLVFNRLDGLIR
jgi:hypothetical protein